MERKQKTYAMVEIAIVPISFFYFYTIIIFFHLASKLRQESFLFISVDTGVQIFPGRLDICLNWPLKPKACWSDKSLEIMWGARL